MNEGTESTTESYTFMHAGKRYSAHGGFDRSTSPGFTVAEAPIVASARTVLHLINAKDGNELKAKILAHFPGLSDWRHEGTAEQPPGGQ